MYEIYTYNNGMYLNKHTLIMFLPPSLSLYAHLFRYARCSKTSNSYVHLWPSEVSSGMRSWSSMVRWRCEWYVFFFISSEWIHLQLQKTQTSRATWTCWVEKATIFSKFHGSSQSFLVLPSLEWVHIPLPKSRHFWRYHDFPELFPFGGICMLVSWKVPYKAGCKDVFDTGTNHQTQHLSHPRRRTKALLELPDKLPPWLLNVSWQSKKVVLLDGSDRNPARPTTTWDGDEPPWKFHEISTYQPQLVRSAGFLNHQKYQLCRSVDFCWKQ